MSAVETDVHPVKSRSFFTFPSQGPNHALSLPATNQCFKKIKYCVVGKVWGKRVKLTWFFLFNRIFMDIPYNTMVYH